MNASAHEFASSHRGSLTSQLSPFWAARYRLRLRPRTPLVLPRWRRGAIVRGGLALSFRRLVCHDMALFCRECPLRADCPYPEIFETSPPPGSDRLRNFSDIPRPFVFDPPGDPRATFDPEDAVSFGLVLAGRATRHLPYFVTAFQALADEGMGPRRARGVLEAVEALDAAGSAVAVYRQGQPVMIPASPPVRASDLVREEDHARDALTLRFLTPVDLRDGGRTVLRPEFGPLVRRLRDRVAALAAFFGDGPIDVDFKGIADAADSVRLTDDRTRRLDVGRRSRSTGQYHDIGGLAGVARYEGTTIASLMALIRLGTLIHVGRHAAFGNGRLEVEE